MTTLPLPATPTPRRTAVDVRVLARRLALLGVMVAVPLTLGLLAGVPEIRPTATWLYAYTPARFLRGEIWTLPLSALVTSRPDALGTNVIVPAVVLAPYVVAFGVLRPLRAFFAGHIVATLLAAVVISLGAAAGWREGSVLLHTVDVGVSAGLAAAGGGLAVALARTRWRPLALLVVGVLLVLFTQRILVEHPADVLADCEHLAAMATGALVEWKHTGRASRTSARTRRGTDARW